MNGFSCFFEPLTQILRVDRTPESIQAGLQTLSTAPFNIVWQALLFHRIAPAIFVLSGMKENTPLCYNSPEQKALYCLLNGQYTLSQKRFMLARSLVIQITERLNNVGIQPLWVKGVILAESLYSDPGMRPFGDLDLIVGPEEYSRAQGALSIFQKTEESLRDTAFIANLSSDSDLQIGIELHNSNGKINYLEHAFEKCLGINWAQEIEKVYAASVPVESALGRIRMISKPFMLRFSCIHYTVHLISSFPPFLWLCDIAFLLNKYRTSLEWNDFPWQIQGTPNPGIENGNPLYLPLLLSSRWLSAPVSDVSLKNLGTITNRLIQSRAETEANTFGAVIYGDRHYGLLSYRLWLSWWQIFQLLLLRVFPSVQKLKEDGYLNYGTSPIAGYIQWYRFMFGAHIKPLLHILFPKH